MKEITKLYKGTLIYFIGNFGSRILSFIMFPIYSYFLSTIEYGMYDLIVSTFALLLPLLTLQVPESIMKFIVDEDKGKVINISIFMCMISIIISTIPGLLISYSRKFSFEIILWLELQLITQYLFQITRALGKKMMYSLSSILSTMIFTISNILMLIYLKMGLMSMIYSGIIAEIFVILYLVFNNKIWKYIKVKLFSQRILKKMIIFSLPLIPNSIIWWIMNSSDKYIINIFMGSSANGIYAVAYKFPTIVIILYSFYNLSWQDYVLLEKENFDYIQIIEQFINLILFGSIVIMFLAKIVSQFWIDKMYYESYYYIPPIIIGMIFYCFSGFFGIAYRKEDRTSREFKTSILGSIVNLIINIMFISFIGLWSAALSTMFSFIIVMIIRYKDTKNFFNYNILNKNNLLKIFILVVNIFFYYININSLTYIVFIISIILFLIFNKLFINNLIEVFKNVKI